MIDAPAIPTPANPPVLPALPETLALSDLATAGLLGVSRSHFRAMVRAGTAPAPVKLGRASRWRRDELIAWLAAGCPPRHRWTWQGKIGGGR